MEYKQILSFASSTKTKSNIKFNSSIRDWYETYLDNYYQFELTYNNYKQLILENEFNQLLEITSDNKEEKSKFERSTKLLTLDQTLLEDNFQLEDFEVEKINFTFSNLDQFNLVNNQVEQPSLSNNQDHRSVVDPLLVDDYELLSLEEQTSVVDQYLKVYRQFSSRTNLDSTILFPTNYYLSSFDLDNNWWSDLGFSKIKPNKDKLSSLLYLRSSSLTFKKFKKNLKIKPTTYDYYLPDFKTSLAETTYLSSRRRRPRYRLAPAKWPKLITFILDRVEKLKKINSHPKYERSHTPPYKKVLAQIFNSYPLNKMGPELQKKLFPLAQQKYYHFGFYQKKKDILFFRRIWKFRRSPMLWFKFKIHHIKKKYYQLFDRPWKYSRYMIRRLRSLRNLYKRYRTYLRYYYLMRYWYHRRLQLPHVKRIFRRHHRHRRPVWTKKARVNFFYPGLKVYPRLKPSQYRRGRLNKKMSQTLRYQLHRQRQEKIQISKINLQFQCQNLPRQTYYKIKDRYRGRSNYVELQKKSLPKINPSFKFVFDLLMKELSKLFKSLSGVPYRLRLDCQRRVMFYFKKNLALYQVFFQLQSFLLFKNKKVHGRKTRLPQVINLKQSLVNARRYLRRGIMAQRDRLLYQRMIKEISHPRLSLQLQQKDLRLSLGGAALL